MASLEHYLFTAPPARLTPLALAVLGFLAATFLASLWWGHSRAKNLLQAQVRRRLGQGIATWAAIESALILWRLLDMGDPRLIPIVGLALGVLLGGYELWFTVWQLPHLQRRFDRLREELAAPYARKRLGGSKSDSSSASSWPMIGGGIGALALWLAMFPSVDHALHWVMVFLGGALGYSVGQALTAGHGVYTLAYRAADPKAKKQASRRSPQRAG